MKRCIATAAVLVTLLGNSQTYGGIVVDGNLAEWGISVADNNLSNYGVPAGSGHTTLGDGSVMYYHQEDQSDSANHAAQLGPNYGGQDYDTEFMGVILNGTQLSIAIVSGLRPDNGFQFFGPGDIRIQTSGGTFGIEVGGGAGGGAGTAIGESSAGTTYQLNSHGATTGLLTTDPLQTAGAIWKDPQWLLDPIAPSGPVQMQANGGTHVGDADYIFTRDSITNQHSIIELTLNAAIFGSATIQSVYWRPSCGNDELNVDVGRDVVPEAATLVTWSLLSVCTGMCLFVRRLRTRRFAVC